MHHLVQQLYPIKANKKIYLRQAVTFVLFSVYPYTFMVNYQHLLQPESLFITLRELAAHHQVPTYVIGGFVRDALTQKSCKDIDIVCVGDSAPIAQGLKKHMGNAHITQFKNFGTTMVKWEDLQVEFVKARKESYSPDSRKPQVATGTLKDDILRRDFTINTLAISLNAENYGQLIDLCQGQKDLANKTICTPLAPQRTFSDDPLRILRGIRFAVQLGYTIAPQTCEAMCSQAHRIRILSKERIITELNKILLSPAPVTGLKLLNRVKLLHWILPELEALKGTETIQGLSHKDNYLHTLQVVENLVQDLPPDHPNRLWLIWAAILHDIAKPATKRFTKHTGFSFHGHEKLGAKMVPAIFRRLGLPMRQNMRYVQKLVRLHLRHIPLVEEEVTDAAIRRFVCDAGNELDDLLRLCRADITSGNTRKVAQYKANFDALATKIKTVEQKDQLRNFQPVITGEIIMETFGLSPCRTVGTIKKALKNAILQGEIPNAYPDAHAYMINYAQGLGLKPHAGEAGSGS